MFSKTLIAAILAISVAANECEKLGQQICVDDHAFKTCSSGNVWSVVQKCGKGTACQTHPSSYNRVICGYKSGGYEDTPKYDQTPKYEDAPKYDDEPKYDEYKAVGRDSYEEKNDYGYEKPKYQKPKYEKPKPKYEEKPKHDEYKPKYEEKPKYDE